MAGPAAAMIAMAIATIAPGRSVNRHAPVVDIALDVAARSVAVACGRGAPAVDVNAPHAQRRCE
jgi:hypothetical protein